MNAEINESIPVAVLSDEARAALTRAMGRALVVTEDESDVARRAAEASRRSNESPSNVEDIENLIRANADLAARRSMQSEVFPDETTVRGLLAMIDLETAVGRKEQVLSNPEEALNHFMTALQLVRQYRAYSRLASVDSMTYGIGSRAASAAGELGVLREMPLVDVLAAIERNLIQPFEDMMVERDLRPLAAFGAVAMARRALLSDIPVAHLAAIRDALIARKQRLTPSEPKAAKRFNAEVSAISEELAVRLGGSRKAAFTW